jgi:hypothetical protein
LPDRSRSALKAHAVARGASERNEIVVDRDRGPRRGDVLFTLKQKI